MFLGLVVLLGGCLIGKGETDDDGIIATADVEVGWISKAKIAETYIDIRVSWVDIEVEVGWTDTNVEVSWTGSFAAVSELNILQFYRIHFSTLCIIFTIMRWHAYDMKQSILCLSLNIRWVIKKNWKAFHIWVSFYVRDTTKKNMNLLLAEQYLQYITTRIEYRIRNTN